MAAARGIPEVHYGMSSEPGGRGFSPPPGTGTLGLRLLLVSFAILFVSTLATYWIVRAQVQYWSAGLPELPVGLWVSTALLGWLSVCSSQFVRQHEAGWDVRRFHGLALLLALAFLLAQAWNWKTLVSANLAPDAPALYAFSFYTLTGLHALHVLGGVFAHLNQWGGFRAGKPPSSEAVGGMATYWHFLGLCWIPLFATLAVGADPDLTSADILAGTRAFALAGCALFALGWLLTVRALWRKAGVSAGLLGLLPPLAWLMAFMRAEELQLKRLVLFWSVAFGIALVGVATHFAVVVAVARTQ